MREAALVSMREALERRTPAEELQVTTEHVERALETVRPSLDPFQVAQLAAYADQRAGR